VQLALVDEQNQELGSAADAIHAALRRNARDWRSWLIAARIETKLGEIGRATRSLVQAQRLNPRSAIFSAERTGISARR
jgi:cytochrome c-type biogenesis protein CcmH/NrfG